MRYDYAFDAAGRLKTKRAIGVNLISYEYDLNGNRTRMTDVTGKHTSYRYNSLNLLEEITDNGRSLAKNIQL
ncbi:MAG: RHS repeat protein [Lachnospiraceae bacterium]|nr:RHS repeat protein [Lachnospiraceae bacterium]